MIVTLMFAQVAYLASLYFTTYTRGEEGLVLQPEIRQVDFLSFNLDLTDPASRYMAALTLLTIALFITLRIVKTPFGRNLVAIRENEERMRMLGYNVFQSNSARSSFPARSRRGRSGLRPVLRLCRLGVLRQSSIRSCRCCGY